ncbi:VanZ family protein OS=Ureibacillus acetophenoni OX=614649 GN=SAMN05877842_104148 PE=4 SV=1 [Ureibacillus acetophenoni]
MILIFSLSHQPASESNELSKGITKVVAQNIEIVSGKEKEINIGSFNNTIRDYAHFTLYFILGAIVASALKKFRLTTANTIMFSILICIVFAITDEWHQLYVSGRGAQLSDVMIDSTGAILGVFCSLCISWIVRSKRIESVE